MSSKHSGREFSFVSYFLFYHNSCNFCAIPEEDVDKEKISLKVEDKEEAKERKEKN